MTTTPDIQHIQREQYVFPYHHISFIDDRGQGSRVRILSWGFEYLIYNTRLASIVQSLEPRSVLDVGCGDGYFLGQLHDKIPTRVGVDIDERALKFAQAFHPHVDYRKADVKDLSERFDVVCAVEVLEHIPDNDISSFLRAMASRVAADGSIVVSVPTVNEPLNRKHFRHYDLPLLEKQFAEALPEYVLEHSEYFYRRTFAERLYRRLTSSFLFRGEIPLLRRFVWGAAKRSAISADSRNGLHLIARFACR
ncbi:class I SAM-dependent methyltransferase [Parvibaculum sp.]|uniref:class I SAM-dependent methyltransferase n=1 Tax=Parvibaculum sp. TaxID=2024848 RepID=UPI000C89BB46|nr:class I SAM-dependent methyltransferase [Parvibaculum sp.]MAB15387.1 hypothetical protein [Parvibaculum sp.]